MRAIAAVLGSLVSGARAVTRKYSRPAIEMTPFVKVSLFALRLYLFVLVGLMVYKFIVTVG